MRIRLRDTVIGDRRGRRTQRARGSVRCCGCDAYPRLCRQPGTSNARLGDLDDLDQEALDKSLSLYGGFKRLIDENGWSGVATRCWPECFTEYGGAACSPQSMFIDEGIPGTCEADVYGNVTALLLQYTAGEPSFVADLVEMDTDGDTGVLWHCGLAPIHMAPISKTPRYHPLEPQAALAQ